MRRIVWTAGLALVLLGIWALRTPTAAIVQLKLAVDRHDLAAVDRRLDREALASEALAGLVGDTPGDAEPIRLAIRGGDGWVPAIPSARSWLRLRLDRTVAGLVEDPARRFVVSWEQLEDTLDTLEQSGSTAFFRFTDVDGAVYAVRMRQGWWHWRIVSVEHDGQPLLLAPAPATAQQPEQVAAMEPPIDDGPDAGIVTEPPDDEAVEAADPEPAAPAAAPALRLAPMTMTATAAPPPAPAQDKTNEHWTQAGRPFVRRLDAKSWTVQIGSSTDALAAAVQRDRAASKGETAVVQEVTVRGTQWHRVLVGAFPTKREADQAAARLASGN
jgi:hypothetical protein